MTPRLLSERMLRAMLLHALMQHDQLDPVTAAMRSGTPIGDVIAMLDSLVADGDAEVIGSRTVRDATGCLSGEYRIYRWRSRVPGTMTGLVIPGVGTVVYDGPPAGLTEMMTRPQTTSGPVIASD